MKVAKKGVSTVCALKTYALVPFLFAFLFLPLCVNATTVDFYTDGTIQSGDNYSKIKIYNDITVEMHGGYVGEVTGQSTSIFNMYGGAVGSIITTGSANLYNGVIDTVVGFGKVNIYGYDFVWTLGETLPQRGVLTGKWENGTSFSINMRDVLPTDTHVVLHVIPEPTTIILFSLTGLFIVKRNY